MSGEQQSSAQWLFEHWREVVTHPVVAALAGSAVSVGQSFPGATAWVKMTNGAIAFTLAIYGGPAFNEVRGIESKTVGAFIILMTAICGLILTNTLLEYLKTTKLADLPIIGAFLKPKPTSDADASANEGAKP